MKTIKSVLLIAILVQLHCNFLYAWGRTETNNTSSEVTYSKRYVYGNYEHEYVTNWNWRIPITVVKRIGITHNTEISASGGLSIDVIQLTVGVTKGVSVTKEIQISESIPPRYPYYLSPYVADFCYRGRYLVYDVKGSNGTGLVKQLHNIEASVSTSRKTCNSRESIFTPYPW